MRCARRIGWRAHEEGNPAIGVKLDVAERWPELFEESDELQRHAGVQSLAAA